MKSRVGAIIVAAGRGQRMGGIDKIFANLGGQPLLARVVDVFQACSLVDQIVIVLSQRNLELGQRLAEEHAWSKVVEVCQGGARRQDSVQEGLKRLEGCDWVVIHDGARPLLKAGLIERGLLEARDSGAAIAAVPVKDTIKFVEAGNLVQGTLERQSLWAVQTPQVFRYNIISEAYRQIKSEVPDDAAAVEKLGHKVKVYMGSYENIKVTTKEDLALAQLILRNREQEKG